MGTILKSIKKTTKKTIDLNKHNTKIKKSLKYVIDVNKISDTIIPKENRKSVGKSVIRVDAYSKVLGTAKYTNDLCPKDAYCAIVVGSTISNGEVIKIDIEEAKKVEGVVNIFTCFDVPNVQFPTAGHPYNLDISHRDPSDRKLLNKRVRLYGDDIAVVVGKNEVACKRAIAKLKIEYKEYKAFSTVEEALDKNASILHTDMVFDKKKKSNIFANTVIKKGDVKNYEEIKNSLIQKNKNGEIVEIEANYKTAHISHCHLELANSFAYIGEDKRITVVSSTQIPHIVRRIVSQALSVPIGQVRIIKPYVGGGFGNKQDALYEPLVAWLTTKLAGHSVYIEIPREQNISNTRSRHSIEAKVKALVNKDGTLLYRDAIFYSNNGAYASHGHSIVSKCAGNFANQYTDKIGARSEAISVYTNTATAGAMRAYGVPQSCWANESLMDDLAYEIGMDPYDFRIKNLCKTDIMYGGVGFYTFGLEKCMEKGKKLIGWDKKRKEYANQKGRIRHGIGMGIYIYQTAVYPISMEQDGACLILNQDGSVNLHLGATEIGQGGDTVFSQMAADACGISFDKVHIISTQDTNLSPFGTGAYGSRQSYVAGRAAKKAGLLLKQKILDFYVTKIDTKRRLKNLDIINNNIIDKKTNKKIFTVSEVALHSYYQKDVAGALAVSVQEETKTNTFATGACFVDIDVDIDLCKIKINNMVSCIDSGTILNPALARGQVQGGVSMSLGFGLSEEILYDKESAKPLNNNLLDYKIPTAMDSIDSNIEFIELEDPTGPYGNKALGEPPTILPAVCIRNALLNATGIHFNEAPMTAQRLFEQFSAAGFYEKG